MEDNWEKLSVSLQPGIGVINGVDPQKYQLILNRICQELLKNPDSIKPFSEIEEDKLLESLSVDANELNILLSSSIIIFNQIIFQVIKPSMLGSVLTSVVKLDEEKSNAFVTIWNTNAKALVYKYKHKSIHNNQLDSVSWLVNIETSNDMKRELFLPKVLLQLRMKGNSDESTLSLDFNEQQLYDFYNTLENIQAELDTLN